MSYTGLNHNKAFKEQVEKHLGTTLEKITMVPIIKVSKKDNTRVISLVMFYENRKSIIFKVLGSVVYCITENYICADYLYLHQYKVYLEYKGYRTQHSMIFHELAFQNY